MRVRKRGDLDGGEVGGSEKEVAKLQSQYITFFLKKIYFNSRKNVERIKAPSSLFSHLLLTLVFMRFSAGALFVPFSEILKVKEVITVKSFYI